MREEDLGNFSAGSMRQREHLDEATVACWVTFCAEAIRPLTLFVALQVAMDIDPARTGRADKTEELFRAAPAVDPRKLQMSDLDMDPASLADIDGFGHRVVDGVRLIADVRRIPGTMLFQDLAERPHLVGFGVEPRGCEQPARHAESTGFERLREHFLHMEKLAVARRAVLHAHRHQAQRVVPDLHDGIHRDCRPRRHIVGEIGFGEGQPGRACRKIMGEEVGLPGQGRRNREAAIADDLRGDPLADLCFRQRIERQGEVGVGMNVDEARGKDPSGPVDLPDRGFGPPRLNG